MEELTFAFAHDPYHANDLHYDHGPDPFLYLFLDRENRTHVLDRDNHDLSYRDHWKAQD